ncbi:MAG: DUF2232 domain-containing protein [Smithellaceae bacterium]
MTKLSLLPSDSSLTRLIVTIMLLLAASLIPVIGVFFLISLPLFFFILYLKNDQKKAMTALTISLGMVLIFLSLAGTALPVLALATMSLAGILIAQSVRRSQSIEAIVLFPTLFILGMIVLFFIYAGMKTSMAPWALVEQYILEAVELNISLYSRMPISAEEINAIRDSKDTIIRVFTRIFPALCFIAVAGTVWMNVLAGQKWLNRSGLSFSGLEQLSEWKAPSWLVWIFIVSGGMSFLPHPQISFAGINFFLIAVFIYLLQGLAIVSFFFQSKNISFFFRLLIYFLIAVQQILMIAIAAVGFFDLWIDFRKYFRKDRTTV